MLAPLCSTWRVFPSWSMLARLAVRALQDSPRKGLEGGCARTQLGRGTWVGVGQKSLASQCKQETSTNFRSTVITGFGFPQSSLLEILDRAEQGSTIHTIHILGQVQDRHLCA